MRKKTGCRRTEKKLSAWLNTDQGKQALAVAQQKAEKTIAQLEADRQINERSLHEPLVLKAGYNLPTALLNLDIAASDQDMYQVLSCKPGALG